MEVFCRCHPGLSLPLLESDHDSLSGANDATIGGGKGCLQLVCSHNGVGLGEINHGFKITAALILHFIRVIIISSLSLIYTLQPIFHWKLGLRWLPNANEINTKYTKCT